MNAIPPVIPTVTTDKKGKTWQKLNHDYDQLHEPTNFVQNGQLNFPAATSSADRSINTHRLQITQSAAARWNRTAQNSLRRSTPLISKLRH